MYTQNRYPFTAVLLWTRIEILLFVLNGVYPVILYKLVGYDFIHIPWTVVAVIGTAVAFLIGFQNNAAYGRIWEARIIWGGIVNTTRKWFMMVRNNVYDKHYNPSASQEALAPEIRKLVMRHVAWLNSLRHAMRESRTWEVVVNERVNKEWAQKMFIPEKVTTLEDDLCIYLSEEERNFVLSQPNAATAVINLQSNHLRDLRDRGVLWPFAFLFLHNVLQELLDLQGKSERIKNFPYPRQFATIQHWALWIFILLLPYSLIPEFTEFGKKVAEDFPSLGSYFVWTSIPLVTLVAWTFHTMSKIGRTGENPFEGTANDVPISTISRSLEIEMRSLLGEEKGNIPAQFPVRHNVQV